jgi:hypothetical protein
MKRTLIAAALVCLTLIAPSFAQDGATPPPAPAEETTQQRPDFNFDALAAAIASGNALRRAARAPTVEERASQIMARHMRSCWQDPADLPNPERLIVTLRFQLNEDGTLRGNPQVVQPGSYIFDRPMRTAVERATTAVRQCPPYPFAADPMLTSRYDTWDEFELVFRAP